MASESKIRVSLRSAKNKSQSASLSRAKHYYIYDGRNLLYRGEFKNVNLSQKKKEDQIVNDLNLLLAGFSPDDFKDPKDRKAKPEKQEYEKPLTFLDIVNREEYDYENTYFVENIFHGVTNEDNLVPHTPVKTLSKVYKKEIVFKNVYSLAYSAILDLEIMDYRLTKAIKLTPNNRNKVREFIYTRMFIHALKFYRERHKATEFLSRLTFRLKGPRGNWLESGIGIERTKVDKESDFINYVLMPLIDPSTFFRSYDINGKLNDYIVNNIKNDIQLTGLTVEAIVGETPADKPPKKRKPKKPRKNKKQKSKSKPAQRHKKKQKR